jgi:hypothetical protein
VNTVTNLGIPQKSGKSFSADSLSASYFKSPFRRVHKIVENTHEREVIGEINVIENIVLTSLLGYDAVYS